MVRRMEGLVMLVLDPDYSMPWCSWSYVGIDKVFQQGKLANTDSGSIMTVIALEKERGWLILVVDVW
jgi:hypothetical protein